MLLKLGATMMAAALAVAVGVALVVLLRAPESSAVANPTPLSSPEATMTTPDQDLDSYEKFSQAKPESEPRLRPRPESKLKSAPERAVRPKQAAKPKRKDEPELRQNALVAGDEGFPAPDEDEVARLDEPRRFAPDSGADLTLSLPSLGVRNAPIYDSDSSRALEAGVAHVPETSMPWDGGEQRNTYLAAHRLGYPGTGSRLLFYELDKLGRGDEVVLRGKGETYRYRVSEILVVDPNDSWVMGQVRGRDMVTLQTCTPVPTFEKRLVVRADRV